MQRMGQMLGAQSIISGSFTDMGGFHRIMIRVLNVQNATVEVQYRANIRNDNIVTALLTGGKTNITVTTPRQNTSSGNNPVAQINETPVTQQQQQAPQLPRQVSEQDLVGTWKGSYGQNGHHRRRHRHDEHPDDGAS